MTATTNFLVRNPEKLARLVSEIRNAFIKEEDITLLSVEKLVYMKAVLQESMRLGPPVPSQIPRIVPPEGDIVCGHHLPGNVRRSS
jgi:cytochrome P450